MGELTAAVARQRRGMRYFAAGRAKDRRMFASILFPLFICDPYEDRYLEAVTDILKVAGGSAMLQPKTRHKLSFDLGVVYFTADARGNVYGVVASEDFPMDDAFKFLDEMVQVYDGVDIHAALEGADVTLWSERRIRDDAFGIRDLAIATWKRMSRPDDGLSYQPCSNTILS